MTGARGTTTTTARNRRGLAPLVMGAALVLTLAGCEREFVLPGERFGTRTPLDAGPGSSEAALDTNTTRAITLGAAERPGDWGSRGYNSRNRTPHLALAAAPVEIWASDIGDGNSRRTRITADPVASAGVVYTIDADARLQASRIDTGAAVWARDLTPDFDRGGNISGGGLAIAGGAVFATTGFGELIRLDLTSGDVIWRQRLGSILGAPTVSGGVIYVTGQNSEAWAVAADDGRLRWQVPSSEAPSVLQGGAAPAVSDRFVHFPFPTGEIATVLPETGVRVWGSQIRGGRLGAAYANINDITADPVVVGNTIYVGNQSGRVVSLDARTGEINWQARDGAYSPVAVAGGSLFFVSDRNELIRLDADTGERVWGVELPLYVARRERRRQAVFTHYGPLIAGGRLVVASGDGAIRFFAPEDGALTGTLELRGGAASHPIVVNDTLLVVSTDGRLHAYR